ncbi:unnamed protein product [Moneuplotes crassus]|uniref:Transmembrane protein 107 n=1 Tax=Euplotes crassus TaxID=5936 RepID=A0AAD1Y113_EUPCR|nr:unnamed protein product [Moneuplotes crassus]
MEYHNINILSRVIPAKFCILLLIILLCVQVILDREDHIYSGISESHSKSSSKYKSQERQLLAATSLMIAFACWEILFMMLGITVHFMLQNLFQVIVHCTAIIYLFWSIFAEWSVGYYWGIVWVFGFIPWFIDLTLFYWGVFRFRPRGIKKLQNVS